MRSLRQVGRLISVKGRNVAPFPRACMAKGRRIIVPGLRFRIRRHMKRSLAAAFVKWRKRMSSLFGEA